MVDQADKLRSLVEEKGLGKNAKITIKVLEGFYKGSYDSIIKSIENNCIVVAMPYKNDKLIPLNAGILVDIELQHKGFVKKFTAEVLERKVRPVPLLYISKPDKISRAGRLKANTTKVIAVTSGKGGVGKTNIAVNLGIAFIQRGKRTVVIDADLGLANVDVILGLNPKYNLAHVIRGEAEIEEVMYKGPYGLYIIPAGSGIEQLINISQWQLTRFINSLNELEALAEVIIIDTGAGLSKTVTSFVIAADEVLVVTTPEPTSITDAYALIKVTSKKHKKNFKVIINRATSPQEAEESMHKLKMTCKKFLDIDLDYLGYILDDKTVNISVKEQVPFIIKNPKSNASRGIYRILSNLSNNEEQSCYESESFGLKEFIKKIISAIR